MADFLQTAGRERFINFFALVWWQIHDLAVRYAIIHGPNFFVDRIGPEIHEADSAVPHLWRRNQRIVWRNHLARIGALHIDIGAKDDFVAVTIQRGVKCGVTILGLVENQIEHHEPCSSRKQPIKQQRPDFTRPREPLLRHQLERTAARDLFSGHWRQVQCALIKSEKNEVLWRRGLSALTPKQIFKALFAPPGRGKKRHIWQEMTQQNQPSPTNAD